MDMVNDILINSDTLIISLLSALGFFVGKKYKDNLYLRLGLMIILFLFKTFIHSSKNKHPHLRPIIEKVHTELSILKKSFNTKLKNTGVA